MLEGDGAMMVLIHTHDLGVLFARPRRAISGDLAPYLGDLALFAHDLVLLRVANRE